MIFLLILPLTLVLDLILYAFTKSCPTCGSFGQFIMQEGALSFPLVVGFMNWFEDVLKFKQQRTS